MMMLAFEEMIARCVDDEAKVHIREAVRCYEAGAYRAAIVSTYISVCFDLIAKLRSLSSGGDGYARTMIALLDNFQQQLGSGNQAAIKGLLEFERELLEAFRDKFDFFGSQEFEELSRLRADRNRCAHPSFTHDTLPYAPPAELARLHLRSALTYVLSQPPRQGKAAIASLRATVTSPYFPTNSEEVVERLRGAEIGTARAPLVKAFIDDLMHGWPSPGHMYHKHSNVLPAMEATLELDRPVALPRLIIAIQKLAKSGDADAVLFAGAAALRVQEAAEQLDDAARTVLKVWLTEEKSPNKGKAVKRALQIGWWRDRAIDALESLTADQLGAVVDPPAEMVTKAAQLYTTARNWESANMLATKLALPLADRFSLADIELVLKATQAGADLPGSHGFREFIDVLYDKNAISEEDLEALLEAHGLDHYRREPQVEEA
ncbi:hypothetical protein [Blastomonas sp.]|uniref:hypothetical protein n=1 Tax=Blastomonas sp. TaxID=1909299 RepID=UPI0026252CCA|nr:hypothetical protein [Blastomonas sp.]MDM7956481.1 hypothetical protein [Blastomonas sp.]